MNVFERFKWFDQPPIRFNAKNAKGKLGRKDLKANPPPLRPCVQKSDRRTLHEAETPLAPTEFCSSIVGKNSISMKHLALFFLSLLLLTGSLVAGQVEVFCKQFTAGAEVHVYRGFQAVGYDRSVFDRAVKAGCFEYSNELFYPEAKTLNEKDAAAYLALATKPDSYYPSTRQPATLAESFHADLAFWCITPDHKNEAYCLVSLGTSEVKVSATGKAETVAMTLELEKFCRVLLERTFEQEIKDEKTPPAPKPSR